MHGRTFHYEEIVSNDSTETNHSVRTIAQCEDLSNRPVLRTRVFLLTGGSGEEIVHISDSYESSNRAKEGHSKVVSDVRLNPQKYSVGEFRKQLSEA